MIFAYDYCPYADAAQSEDWLQSADRIYRDIGERHQLQQMCRDCRQEPPVTLLVRRLADLGESLQAVGDRLSEFSQLGVTIRTAEADDLSPYDLQSLRLAQTISRQQQRQRICQGHANARIQGQPPPGKAPYGYRRGPDCYTLDRSAAAVARAFFEHFLLYGALRRSVRYLAEAHGKKISVSTGKRWLSSPVYRGDLAYHSGDVIPDAHAPILSRDEAAQIDRLLRRNRQFASRSSTAPRSLAGLVVCGRCQTSMTVGQTTPKRGRRRGKTYLYLRPSHCPYRDVDSGRCSSLPYADVLGKTVDRICDELPRTVGQSALPPVDSIKANLAQQIDAKQGILDQLGSFEAQGILDRQTAALRAYTLQTEIAALREQSGQLPPASLMSIAQTVSIPQFWFDLSETERRFYFREFIQQIELTQQDGDWDLSLSYRF
ncbi:MAG: recombinase family protein [Elainellaceae cyanobacterium]